MTQYYFHLLVCVLKLSSNLFCIVNILFWL